MKRFGTEREQTPAEGIIILTLVWTMALLV